MRPLAFGRRLLITAIGASLGFLGTLLGIAADRSVDIHAEAIAILFAVAAVAALAGAAASRRWMTAVIAAVFAAAAVPATALVIIVAACSSGAICD
jgi:hypothetical protein